MAKPFRLGHATELSYFSPDDAEVLAGWYYDYSYRFFFRDFGQALELEDLKNLGERLGLSGIRLLVIRDKTTQKPIGLMTFVLEKSSAKIYKFGIMLDDAIQHKTWAIDAIVILSDHIFKTLNAHKLVVEFCDKDAHIHRITAKGGFIHEATLKEEIFVDGVYYDEARYSLARQTYFDLYGDFLPPESEIGG